MTIGVDLGCGPNPQCEIGIDIVPFEGVIACDLAVEKIPLPDNSQPYVRAYDFLEHIPVLIYWTDIHGRINRRLCRIELMREIYRILKPGGIFESMTAYYNGNNFGWAYDPTHMGPPWTRQTFSYFCGLCEKEAKIYNINFQFKIEEIREGGEHIFVRLSKPL